MLDKVLHLGFKRTERLVVFKETMLYIWRMNYEEHSVIVGYALQNEIADSKFRMYFKIFRTKTWHNCDVALILYL